jgi:hypothetical protein
LTKNFRNRPSVLFQITFRGPLRDVPAKLSQDLLDVFRWQTGKLLT